MSEITATTVYFDKPGPANTARTLEIVHQRAVELGIRTILVSTISGATGVQAAQMLAQDFNLIVVTHSTGLRASNIQELTLENRAAIETTGTTILTCQHAFGGVGRAVRKKLGTYELEEIIAYTLRNFGQGVKVCAEIALMAADAGLVRTDEPCIAVGGTGRGADTALGMLPTNAQTFFDLRVVEFLCLPSPRHPAFQDKSPSKG
jgi:hypothetical protein